MNIVKLFRAVTNKLNDEQKCDMCWEFSAPFWEDQSNIVQPAEPCCTQVRLINYSDNKVNEYKNGFINSFYVDYTFTIQLLVPSNIGLNIDNEIKDYDLSESRWETKFYPLRECWKDASFINWCELIGLQVEVTSWKFTMLKNYMDNNLDGWNINCVVRVKNEYDEIKPTYDLR